MKKSLIFISVLLVLISSASALEINHMPYLDMFASNGTSINVTGDYSASAMNFSIAPNENETWYIARMLAEIEDTKGFTPDEYGNLGTELTVGYNIILDQNGTRTLLTNGEPIKTNLDFARYAFDVQLHNFGVGASTDFLSIRWSFFKANTYLKLNGTTNDSIFLEFNDDFTGLEDHIFNFQGFIWQEEDVADTEVSMVYTIALVIGIFALSYFFFIFADHFKIEGDSAAKALVSASLNILLKLTSFGTVVFNLFFMRFVLEAQTQIQAVQNMLAIYDVYLTYFMWIIFLFFVLFFVHQLVLVTDNYKIWKNNKLLDAENKRKF